MSLQTELLAIFSKVGGNTALKSSQDIALAIENHVGIGMVPIGSIISWHKNLSGVGSLPSSFLECNGQTVNDADSPLNGETLPEINSSSRFIRGGLNSGQLQNDAFQGFQIGGEAGGSTYYGLLPSAYDTWFTEKPSQNSARSWFNKEFQGNSAMIKPINDGTNGTPRTANETRPKNISMIWIIRIK